MKYFDRLKNQNVSRRLGEQGTGLKRARRRVVRDIVPPSAEPTEEALRSRRPPGPSAEFLASRAESLPRPSPELQKPPAAIPEEELAVRTWEPEGVRQRRMRTRIFAGAFILLGLLGFLLPTAVFPKVSIIILPKIRSLPVPRLELSADTAVTAPEPASRRLPAFTIAVEKSVNREYEASGKKFVEERAEGTVVVFNAFSSSPQVLVATTRFQDSSGKVFRLHSDIVIPGAEISEGKIVPTSIAARVKAERPGEEYNTGPTEFRIPGFRGTPKYQGFYAKSEKAFTGGFRGEARIVLSEDLTRSSEDLTSHAVKELEAELQRKIPPDPDFMVPNGAREITVTNITQPRPGERFQRFPVSVSARGRFIAFRRSHVAQIAGAFLLPKNTELPIKLPTEQSELVIEGARLGPKPTELRFVATGNLAYWHETNTADVAKTLRTSTPKKLEAYLRSRDEIGSFRIKRFPRWLWFIPKREGGLEVTLQAPA